MNDRRACAWVLLSLLCGAGCASSAKNGAAGADASGGGEATAAPSAEANEHPGERAAVQARESGPASLTLDAQVRGKSVPAKVRLLSADGSEAASGEAGQPIEVQSGQYTLEVSISDEAALIDKPTQRRELVVNAGDELREKAEFPWSMVQLNVRVNGKLDKGAKVILLRDDKEVATVKSNAAPAAITPGRYEAVVETRGARIEVKGILFPDSGSETMPVDVRM